MWIIIKGCYKHSTVLSHSHWNTAKDVQQGNINEIRKEINLEIYIYFSLITCDFHTDNE